MTAASICSQSFSAGQVIFSEGEPGFSLYVVRKGQVIVTRRGVTSTAATSTKTIAILGPGELVGEMAIASGEPRSATATAMSDCVLTVLPKDVIDQRMETADPILKLLLLTAFERLRVFAARSEDAA
jgi:diguanylate cyclase